MRVERQLDTGWVAADSFASPEEHIELVREVVDWAAMVPDTRKTGCDREGPPLSAAVSWWSHPQRPVYLDTPSSTELACMGS